MDRYRQYYVYILASRRNRTLYTGVSGDLVKRVAAHKSDIIEWFTKQYGVHRLVWFETHRDIQAAIRREKRIKEWRRTWKLELIEGFNPDWDDHYDRLF
jgi:putative endonuclease